MNHHAMWSKEVKAACIKAILEGKTRYYVAKTYGPGNTTLNRWLKQAGIDVSYHQVRTALGGFELKRNAVQAIVV